MKRLLRPRGGAVRRVREPLRVQCKILAKFMDKKGMRKRAHPFYFMDRTSPRVL